MSNTNLLGSEEWAVVATIDPASYPASPNNQKSDVVDMSKFSSLIAVVCAGILGAGGTITAKLQSATTSGGTYADITGKAITTLEDSPADFDNNKQAIINLAGDELTEGHRYVRLYVGITAASTLASAVILGKGKSLPASDNDLASVDSITA